MRWPLLLLLLLPLSSCREKDPWAGDPTVPITISFNQHIRPLLTRECLQCHGKKDPQGGLRLDRSSGVASVTTDNSPKKSLLWEKILAGHPSPLTSQDQAILWRWIKQGSPSEGHWASLPLRTYAEGSLPSALSADSAINDDELAFLTRSLFGRRPTATELEHNQTQQPSRAILLDSMMRRPDFAEFFKTRLLLLSGSNPVSNDTPFAPYLRWLDTEVSKPDFALDDFFRTSLGGDLIPGAGQEGALATAWLRLPSRQDLPTPASRIASSLLALDLSQEPSPSDLWPSAAETLPTFLPAFPSAMQGDLPTPPLLPIHTPKQLQDLAAERLKEPDLWQAARTMPESAPTRFNSWLAEEEPAVSIPDLASAFAFDSEAPTDLAPKPSARLAQPVSVSRGVQGTALAPPGNFIGLPLASDRAFTLSFFLNLSHLPAGETPLLFSRTQGGAATGFGLSIAPDHLTISLRKGSLANSLTAQSATLPHPGNWHHLAIGYDGSRQASGLRLWIDSQPIDLTITHDQLYGTASSAHSLNFNFPVSEVHPPTLIDELQLYQALLSDIEIAHLRDGKALLTAVRDDYPREDLLFTYYLRSKDPTSRGNTHRAIISSHKISNLQETALLVPVAEARPLPQVRPTLPFFSLSLDANANRLGLAHWLFDARNPITARVVVSRLYQMVHGVNLLPAEDISDPWKIPSNPDFLDFLAQDLLRNDWNLRASLHTIFLHPPLQEEPLAAAN